MKVSLTLSMIALVAIVSSSMQAGPNNGGPTIKNACDKPLSIRATYPDTAEEYSNIPQGGIISFDIAKDVDGRRQVITGIEFPGSEIEPISFEGKSEGTIRTFRKDVE